jgi:hypothetical protein
VTSRAACSSRILGEDPVGDGPGVMMTSSFRVETLGPCRRPRLGRTPTEGVVDAEDAAAPFNCQDPSLQDRIIL